MKKIASAFFILGICFTSFSCATSGPAVSPVEVDQKRAELETKAAKYKETQLNRVKAITDRLIQFMPAEAQAKLKNIQVKVSDEADINAHASFNELVVNYGLLRFTDSDDQLATVVAHELAHIVKGHVQKNLATNVIATAAGAVAGTAIDSVGGSGIGSVVSAGLRNGIAGAFSRDFEREADYYGFQYLYIAGFDVLKGAEIWERFAIEAPKSMTSNLFSTHPSSPERLIRAEKILTELQTQGVSQNLFQHAGFSMPMPTALFRKVSSMGFVAGQSAGVQSSFSGSQKADDSSSDAAKAELKALRDEIAQLKKEQAALEQNGEHQNKTQQDQVLLERALEEAQEANKQLRYAEFGVKNMGIAKKVTNFLVAKRVEGEQRIFSVSQGSIDWFVQYDQKSFNSFKALALQYRKYRIYWYSPNKKLYSEQDFLQSQVRIEFAKTTLTWDQSLGNYLIGEWKVRVFEDGKLLDERTFEIVR